MERAMSAGARDKQIAPCVPTGSASGRRPRAAAAFSLLELLVVIALLGLLAVLAAPAMNAIGGGGVVTREGQLLNDQITLARQMAVSRNRETELRLIEYSGSGGDHWAIQIWDPAAAKPLNRLTRLADNAVINPSSSLSPLLGHLESSNAVFGPLGNSPRSYRAIRFRPNGRIKGNFPVREDYLTVQLRRESPDQPVNYFTLQIQSLTGRISVYRP